MSLGDTIVARATPEGKGAIAIIRLSGPDSRRILQEVFRSSRSDPCRHPRVLVSGAVQDSRGRLLDEVMGAFFAAPRSYTGEDMAEIHCHGGEAVVRAILDLLLEHGAREAQRGEFSQRAFENGKRSLVSLEGILQLIQAGSREQVIGAMRALGGEFERELRQLQQSLTTLLTQVEACLDFSDEPDIQALGWTPLGAVREQTLRIQQRIRRSVGRGLEVVLAGRPNVGKSSLMNAMTGRTTSIVTSEAGTTRDVVRCAFNLDGHLLELLDTAGIEGDEPLSGEADRAAARVAREQIGRADLLLWITDSVADLDPRTTPGSSEHTLRVLNKADLLDEQAKERLSARSGPAVFLTSALTGAGVEGLLGAVRDELAQRLGPADGVPISVRQDQCLRELGRAVGQLGLSLEQGRLELAAIDLGDALRACAGLLGEDVEVDVLNSIFEHFCVGK